MKQHKILFLIAALILIGYNILPVAAQSVPCTRQYLKWIATTIGSESCEWEMQSGSTLDIQAGVTETHANDVTFSGELTLSGTVIQDGVTSSGPTLHGSETGVEDGTQIAHGLGTTPTTILITVITDSLTGTYFVKARDATSFTFGIDTVDTGLVVDWMVGQ